MWLVGSPGDNKIDLNFILASFGVCLHQVEMLDRIECWYVMGAFCAYDLLLIADTHECISRLEEWKAGMKNKGHRVHIRTPSSSSFVLTMMSSGNLPRTPVLSALVESAQTPFILHSVCCESRRSAVASLVAESNYACTRCKCELRPIYGRILTEVDVDDTVLDVKATLSYLCDMMCSDRYCNSAIAARCCVAWGKFKNL